MYESIDELPDSVSDVLPEEAQELYVEAYNRSWELHDEEKSGGMSQEAEANRDAWSAVKREYTRDDETGKWHPAGEVPEHEDGEEEGGILDKIGDAL